MVQKVKKGNSMIRNTTDKRGKGKYIVGRDKSEDRWRLRERGNRWNRSNR